MFPTKMSAFKSALEDSARTQHLARSPFNFQFKHTKYAASEFKLSSSPSCHARRPHAAAARN